MEAYMWPVLVVLSLMCLHPALSVTKSKLIVKVPHKIKHIHINHLKPVHVRILESKKFHHHYHENVGHEGKGGKGKEQRSFSDIKPIVWSPELHLEDFKRPEGALAFTLGNKQKPHYKKRTKHFKNSRRPKHFNSYKNDHWESSPHVFQSSDDDDYDDSQHAFSNQEWLRFEENALRNKNNRGFSRGFRQNKGKYVSSKGKHGRLEQDDSGWIPMMNFEDINDDENNFKTQHGDQLFNSEDFDLQDNSEDGTYSKNHADIRIPKKTQRAPQKNNDKESWNNQSEQNYKNGNPFISQSESTQQKTLSSIRDDLHSLNPNTLKYLKESLLSDIEPKHPRTSFIQQKPLQNQKSLFNIRDDLHSLEPSSFKYLKESLLSDIEPKHPRTSFLQQQPLQNQQPLSNIRDDLHSLEPSGFKYLKESHLTDIGPKHQSTSFSQQRPLQNQKPGHQFNSQVQQVNLNIQPKQPKQQERQPPKKRLQSDVPQQTPQKQNSLPKVHQHEWHQQTVHTTNHQQHFVPGHVLSAPTEGLINNHKSTEKTPHSSASLIRTSSSQNPLKANRGVIEVNPHKPEVKWHQSVQTGKDGTGSYNFEVVNYSPSSKVNSGV